MDRKYGNESKKRDMRGMEPVKKGTYDVIVAGGGIAGVAAAVSAAREGAGVLLLEKSINLGGLATAGLVSWYEPLCDGRGSQVIYGIAEELIRLAVKYGFDTLPEKWGGSSNSTKRERYATLFSPTVFMTALDQYVLENHVTLRFDSLVTYPVMEKNRCLGVVVESAGGREFFEGSVVVDATGNAAVMHRAGVPTVEGKNYMTYMAHYYDAGMAKNLSETGDMSAFRKWLNIGSDMLGNGQPEGQELVTGVTAEEITDYVIAGKKLLLEHIKKQDRNSFDVMALPFMPQLRTIRRIEGDCDFEAIDGKKYKDSVGECGDFRVEGKGKRYQIPAGALYNSKFPNLIAAGRIISAPEGNGWEVSRVIPVCALTGEAAGRMAARWAKNTLWTKV